MDDWQKGDLALCVKVGPWVRMTTGEVVPVPIRAGMVLTVRGVASYVGEAVLWFTGYGGDGIADAFVATKFRKVTPPAADEFDRETIALMNGVRVGEPA